MDFFRRGEKRATTFGIERILVPLLGDPGVDDPALKVAGAAPRGREGVEVSLLHVIEVPFDRTLDTEDEAAVARADEIVSGAKAALTATASRRVRSPSRHAPPARRSWTTRTRLASTSS